MIGYAGVSNVMKVYAGVSNVMKVYAGVSNVMKVYAGVSNVMKVYAGVSNVMKVYAAAHYEQRCAGTRPVRTGKPLRPRWLSSTPRMSYWLLALR
jgi:hypothetical protein